MDKRYKLNIQHFSDSEPNPQPSEDKTFSQDDVNSFVANARKEAETKLLSDLGIEDKNKFKESQEATMKELNDYKVKDIKIAKAIEHGLPMDKIDLIAGSDEESITSHVKGLVDLIKVNKVEPEPNPEKGQKKVTGFGAALEEIVGGKK